MQNTQRRIETRIREAALAAGFDLAGIAPVREFGELAHFQQWIAAGRAGDMGIWNRAPKLASCGVLR